MTCNGNFSHPPTYIVGEDWKKTVYHCLVQIELIQFERLTVGLRGVKVWRGTAKTLTYEDGNFGTHSRMWKMREIKIYPIQMKIAREISGGYSLYHLMIFTPWSSACGVICTGGALLRVQVGGAKPRSACSAGSTHRYLGSDSIPFTSHPVDEGRKQSVSVTHLEIMRRSRKA